MCAGLKTIPTPKKTPEKSSVFAPPGLAALGAVAALPAALPALVAGGVEARGASINGQNLRVSLHLHLSLLRVETTSSAGYTGGVPRCMDWLHDRTQELCTTWAESEEEPLIGRACLSHRKDPCSDGIKWGGPLQILCHRKPCDSAERVVQAVSSH